MKAFDLQIRPALSPHVRLQTDAITGQAVLLYPEGVLELNPTAHDILVRCTGEVSLAEILAALAAEYEAASEELQHDVFECLEQLGARHFVILGS
jgi:pyrroloquinoline quinone biosynthesis protein D